ncbi:DUF1800 domain-containing protein [Sedimentitalea sp. JM2-8]|uniref:DUF1800 domain-containing protein n=1 Tax=Sedimentitalea xiamensis TaxID=3050037 RepID=A0ABT7FEG9_9RHOB|nr:DUF1800 domain-containing protein [Sedimentitalea xiamensis]MDK3073214.1 DUF1800 domain-containing protein [Sedimentitalea xiamensis]
MPFRPEQAAVRFGCGFSPALPLPASPEALLDGLRGPDQMALRFPVETFSDYSRHLVKAADMRRTARKTGTVDETRQALRTFRQGLGAQSHRWHANHLLRWTWSETPLRERLAQFWADHFTAAGKSNILVHSALPFVEEAIRPNMTGRFADLLIATTTHPLMLHYLDQALSVGPNSQAASRVERLGGLNENLAREVLELHTLGVNGAYTQADVRQLAELFTGLTYQPETGFRFRPAFAEPGSETVLGQTYGGDPARLEPVLDALRDLAVHPATARHVAGKLAVHFTGDAPDPALVEHVAARFAETGGELMAVYAALIEHPAAWSDGPVNVKPPLDYIGSACRALAVPPEHVQALDPKVLRRSLVNPLREMGQPLFRPSGPDGWPEEDAAWITPPLVSARLRWALSAPAALCPELPDPRAFVDTALGPYATEPVRFAAAAAESRRDAIGLVLSAPAFQRR